jgi:hypothetical protein
MSDAKTVQAYEVTYENAECGSSCSDPLCPYSHEQGWSVKGHEGLFKTRDEALASVQS